MRWTEIVALVACVFGGGPGTASGLNGFAVLVEAIMGLALLAPLLASFE